MLRFYYTGTNKSGETQQNPSQSLGGNFSISLVPNGVLGAMFGEISTSILQIDQYEYIALALKNETGANVTDVMFGIEQPLDNSATIEIAAIVPSRDNCNNFVIERVPNKYSQPISVQTFYPALIAKAQVVFNSIVTRPNIGDQLNIVEGITIVATTLPLVGIGDMEIYEAIALALENNILYNAIVEEKKEVLLPNSVAITPTLTIQKKDIGIATNLISIRIVSSSTAITPPQSLSGGLDNSINLGNILQNEYIGIWLRRKPTKEAKLQLKGKGTLDCEYLAKTFIAEEDVNTSDEFKIAIDWI